MEQFVSDQGIMTLVTVAVIAICAVLALYVLYSVIWRAVRRGLREYHRPVPVPITPAAPANVTRLVRRPATVKVPDYLPRDWV